MIRFAEPGDHPRLKALWQDIFGDSKESVEEYFSLCHRDDGMLVSESAGAVQGMLSMLPFALETGRAVYPARYVYAVATDPAHRGLGIASDLLARAHEVMLERGEAASVLVPASESLFGYYARRGYKTAFRVAEAEVRAEDLPPIPSGAAAAPCSPTEFTRMRDAAFAGGLFARWDERAVAFATLGNGITRVSAPSGEGCALWEVLEDGIFVRELALLGLSAYEALSILNGGLNAPILRVRLMEGMLPRVPARSYGMIRWLIPEPEQGEGTPYLSLALD